MPGQGSFAAGVFASMATILALVRLLPSVKLKNQVLYTAPRLPYSSNGPPIGDPTDRYRLFVNRTIPPVEQMDSTSTPREPGRKP